ncbi:hypothetical protein KJ909_03050, partial [Patescibacteria group bacterium]|nr:hypothetical protein [Patescibacteria group bacterium]
TIPIFYHHRHSRSNRCIPRRNLKLKSETTTREDLVSDIYGNISVLRVSKEYLNSLYRLRIFYPKMGPSVNLYT